MFESSFQRISHRSLWDFCGHSDMTLRSTPFGSGQDISVFGLGGFMASILTISSGFLKPNLNLRHYIVLASFLKTWLCHLSANSYGL